MKALKIIILSFILIIFCSFTDSKFKKISNQLYSISIPADWECGNPKILKDCSVPTEMKGYLYHKYYFQWLKRGADFPMGLNIRSYHRLDGNIATIEEIEAIIFHGNEKIKGKKLINVKNTSNQKRFGFKSEEDFMCVYKGMYKKNVYKNYLFHKSKNKIHCIWVSVNEDYYTVPEIPQLVNEILDSFVAKD